MPFSSMMVELESHREMTLPPSSLTFSTAYWATLPEPLTATVLPLKSSPRVASISAAKYTQP